MNQENQNLEYLKQRAFEICLAVFRVTKLFPEGEVLGNQLRETSSKIVVALATKQIGDTILNIEAINVYLEIAKHQRWINPLNFDLLIRAYCGFLEAVKKLGAMGEAERNKKQTSPPPQSNPARPKKKEAQKVVIMTELERRQNQIIEFLENSGPAKTFDIAKAVSNISERTVRNDLTVLIEKGMVKKNGNNRTAHYSL